MYKIHPGKMDLWLEGWRTGVVPIREKLGFHVTQAWVIPEENTFLWMMAYDGDNWAAQDAAYFVSPERKALDPDPAQYIAEMRQWFVTPVVEPGETGSRFGNL
jgi:hypothetical protein